MQLAGLRTISLPPQRQGCSRPQQPGSFKQRRHVRCTQASDDGASPSTNSDMLLLISKLDTAIEKQNSAFAEKLAAAYKETNERISTELQLALEQERSARERGLEQERSARERGLEQERSARERGLEQERSAREVALEKAQAELFKFTNYSLFALVILFILLGADPDSFLGRFGQVLLGKLLPFP
jgi:hypothetical protein